MSDFYDKAYHKAKTPSPEIRALAMRTRATDTTPTRPPSTREVPSMHNFHASKDTVFFHHGDYSDSVTIQTPVKRGEPQHNSVEVPMTDLLEFVANYVALEKIQALETATPEQVLGMKGAHGA